ncbi:MAG: hypothetical protein ABSG91_06570 [Syntrophobacteraceae bacterium]|jgi:hypothetical protein
MRITVNIPDNLNENLRREALNRGVSVSRLVSEALSRHFLDSRRKTIGRKVLELAGKGSVSEDADSILDEGRHDDRA